MDDVVILFLTKFHIHKSKTLHRNSVFYLFVMNINLILNLDSKKTKTM